ncbi:hypothetical protein D3C76_1479330 [compost metagenome]
MLADLVDALGRGGQLHHALAHRFTDLLDVGHGVAHIRTDGADHLADLTGRATGALRQLPHFVRHHGEPTALLSCPRRLDRRVERQQVGLVGDAADHRDDPGDLLRAFFQVTHRAGHHVHGLVDMGNAG